MGYGHPDAISIHDGRHPMTDQPRSTVLIPSREIDLSPFAPDQLHRNGLQGETSATPLIRFADFVNFVKNRDLKCSWIPQTQ